MTKACRFAATLALFAALAATFAACRPFVSAGTKPSADPSVSSKATAQSNSCTTAMSVASSSSPAMDFLPGDKPYSDLKVENIERIRMIVNRDSQPPDWPDPFKDATSPKDLQALVSILSIIEIKAKTDESYMPVGATGYSFFVTMKDGNVTQIYLYGNQNLSEPNRVIYEIEKLSGLDAAFDALSGRTRLLPNTSDTSQNLSLFEMDGWNYYFEPVDGRAYPPANLVREDAKGNVEVVYRQVDIIKPAIFFGRNRILLVQDQNTDSRVDDFLLISFNPDGSFVKTLHPQNGIADSPMWDSYRLYADSYTSDDACFYYVGWSQDLQYPRPLYRVDENLTKAEKVMDIPGLLLKVENGNVFCLSADHKSLLKLPSGKAVAKFTNPIENTEYSGGMWILYEKDGSVFEWPVEGECVPIIKQN